MVQVASASLTALISARENASKCSQNATEAATAGASEWKGARAMKGDRGSGRRQRQWKGTGAVPGIGTGPGALTVARSVGFVGSIWVAAVMFCVTLMSCCIVACRFVARLSLASQMVKLFCCCCCCPRCCLRVYDSLIIYD